MSNATNNDRYAALTTDWLAEVSNHTDAMLGYWDKNLVCRYANQAYQKWFGKTPEQMIDKITMKELLGPLFEKNLPFIQGVLLGQQQVFERDIRLPSGETRTSIATYYPHEKNGTIEGFFVHVADATVIKNKMNLPDKHMIPWNNWPGKAACLQEQLLQQITETLQQHIFEKFPGIATLAKKHFLSPTKLKNDFKNRYKITPYIFYRNLQMELAEKYLQDNLYTKSDLARLFNFSSTVNFVDCYHSYQSRKAIATGTLNDEK